MGGVVFAVEEVNSTVAPVRSVRRCFQVVRVGDSLLLRKPSDELNLSVWSLGVGPESMVFELVGVGPACPDELALLIVEAKEQFTD